MVVSEGWEFHFHHNVYFHPNVRTDGFEHLPEMFKRCKLIWGIEQDTYQRCVDSEMSMGKKVEQDAVVRRFGQSFPDFLKEPRFWDHPTTGSSIFLWTPALSNPGLHKWRMVSLFFFSQRLQICLLIDLILNLQPLACYDFYTTSYFSPFLSLPPSVAGRSWYTVISSYLSITTYCLLRHSIAQYGAAMHSLLTHARLLTYAQHTQHAYLHAAFLYSI